MGGVGLGEADRARDLLGRINSWTGQTLTFMEVCGTHTMAAARSGIRTLLPSTIRLISGPGCPVCVTPVGYMDHCLALAATGKMSIATFGDLMRVPGSQREGLQGPPNDLTSARARGADIAIIYSLLDALDLARQRPQHQVVFLGVGFETTAPVLAAAILKAESEKLDNFSVLLAAKTIPEAMAQLASSEELKLDGFLCPGHVSVVLGEAVYLPLVEKHRMPCAIAGFEPTEMLTGICALIDQVASGVPRVDNCYPGAVRPDGNQKATVTLYRVFEPCDSTWRGLGEIPGSGLRIREAYGKFDAARKFDVDVPPPVEPEGCRCGEVLSGVLDPADCPLYRTACTPDRPQGACMVSQEGACAASYLYREGE
jgi:hydrogenase expression/formation protein HypD